MNSQTERTKVTKQYKTKAKNKSTIAKVRNAHTIMAGLKMISNAHKNNSIIMISDSFNMTAINTTQSHTLVFIII